MAKKKKKDGKKRKEVFHAPKTIGEKRSIPMSPMMWTLSGISWVIQLAMTIFAITVVSKTYEKAPFLDLNGFVINSAVLYLALPAFSWILTLCLRIAMKTLPLEMWRMPESVRNGVVKMNGVPMKLTTILVELACAIAFFYIDISIYCWGEPSNIGLGVWIAALAAAIWFPLRKAYNVEIGKIVLPEEEEN